MSFRHLVLGFVSTAFVASTLSIQAVTPTRPDVSNNEEGVTNYSATQPNSGYSARASKVDPYTWGASAAVVYELKQAAKLQKEKNPKKAERVLITILSRVDGLEKPKPVDLALPLLALSNYYRDAKKPQEGLAYANRLLQIDRERFSERSLFVAEDLRLIGDLEAANGNYDDAARTYQKALRIANKASDSQYCPNIIAADANKLRKSNLLFGLYDGLALANFQPIADDEEDDGTAAANADAYFSKAVKEMLKSPDNVDKYKRANVLFTRYKEYLKTSDQADKAAKAEDQIEDYERKIQADRVYRVVRPVN